VHKHRQRDIVVIGGGVVGASLSYRLARSGAHVTCVERNFPGASASGASFSVDITRKTPKCFFDLSVAAAQEHVGLENELGTASWRHPAVTLEWGRTDHERAVIHERVERLCGWGCNAQLINRPAAQELAPPARFLDHDDDRIALYPGQAWYDSVILTQLLLWHAPRHGATDIVGEGVDRIDSEGGRVNGVRTDRGRGFVADIIVNCAGPEANSIARLARAWLPVEKVPGLVGLARADAVELTAILMAPGVNVRPAGESRLKLHSYEADTLLLGDAPNERRRARCSANTRRRCSPLSARRSCCAAILESAQSRPTGSQLSVSSPKSRACTPQ
jgi:glycine/D-amino acid oxidase-like deaminating enzyme